MLTDFTDIETRWRAEADVRWRGLAAEHPSLEPAIRLQRALVGSAIELSSRIDRQWTPPAIAEDLLIGKLEAGVPVLRGESWSAPPDLLTEAVLTFCDHLTAGGGELSARRMKDAVESGTIDPMSLVAASLSRNQHAFHCSAVQLDIAADLLWLVAELVAAPFAHAWQTTRVSSLAGEAVSDALARWQRGYCPACGSWPVFAFSNSGDWREVTLCCSFCGAIWQRSPQCVYCQEHDSEAFIEIAPLPDRDHLRLQLCQSCHGYLKSVIAAPIPFRLLPIEDLATTPLDIVAAEKGFTKPALAVINT